MTKSLLISLKPVRFVTFLTLVSFNLPMARADSEDKPKNEQTAPAEEGKSKGRAKKRKRGDASAAPGVGSTPPPPLPRKVLLPKVQLNVEDSEDVLEFNFKENQFSIVFMLGTWNKRSGEITQFLNSNAESFTKKKIGMLGMFSHDTKVSLAGWKKVEKPLFTVGLCQDAFIETLQNPKVPSMWIVNSKREILHFVELPTQEALDTAKSKLLLWTDF